MASGLRPGWASRKAADAGAGSARARVRMGLNLEQRGPEQRGLESGSGSGTGTAGGSAPLGAMPGEVIGGMQGNASSADGQLARSNESQAHGGQANGNSFGGSQQNGQGRSFNAGQGNGQNAGQNGASTPGGTKRWKKKTFRDRDRPRPMDGGGGAQQNAGGFAQPNGGGFGQPSSGGGFRGPETHQPGNGGGGFKRKGGFGGKQRNGSGGSRGGFVGPMDHSYRAPNGNIFDSSASTIDTYQGGGGGGRGRSYQSDSQPIDYSQGRAVPIKEGTQTKIFFFIEDLFFTAKIQETARKLGVKVEFLKNEKEKIAELTSADEENRPGLIVFDLNNANAKPLTLIPKLKTKLKKSTSIIGFLSHLQGDLKAKAVEAGCDTVMPRAAFSQNLPNLLRRYGIEEAEEPNYNQ